jgi:hypothetical protein
MRLGRDHQDGQLAARRSVLGAFRETLDIVEGSLWYPARRGAWGSRPAHIGGAGAFPASWFRGFSGRSSCEPVVDRYRARRLLSSALLCFLLAGLQIVWILGCVFRHSALV